MVQIAQSALGGAEISPGPAIAQFYPILIAKFPQRIPSPRFK